MNYNTLNRKNNIAKLKIQKSLAKAKKNGALWRQRKKIYCVYVCVKKVVCKKKYQKQIRGKIKNN